MKALVDGKLVDLPAIQPTVEELRPQKRQEILDAYTAAASQPVTDSAGRTWPGGYNFLRELRDRRDFTRDYAPGSTLTMPGIDTQYNLTVDEATAVIGELGMVVLGNADRRDWLLEQVKQAKTVADLESINW